MLFMYVENCLYCTHYRISDWALCLKIELGVKDALFVFLFVLERRRKMNSFPRETFRSYVDQIRYRHDHG